MKVFQVQNLSGNPAGNELHELAIFYSKRKAEEYKKYLQEECGIKHGDQFPILEMRLEEKKNNE